MNASSVTSIFSNMLFEGSFKEKDNSGEKLNKCNQCDYASSQTGNMGTHLKTHSRGKSNKCNQCDYASSHTGNLRTRLKTHSGGKSNKCDHRD